MKQIFRDECSYDSDESHTSNTFVTSSDEEESDLLYRYHNQSRGLTRNRTRKSTLSRDLFSPITGRRNDSGAVTSPIFARHRLVWCLCTLGVVAVLAMVSSTATTSTVSRGFPKLNTSLRSSKLPPKLQELGWMDAVEYFRVAMADASVEMWEREMAVQKALEKEPDLMADFTDFEKYMVDKWEGKEIET